MRPPAEADCRGTRLRTLELHTQMLSAIVAHGCASVQTPASRPRIAQ